MSGPLTAQEARSKAIFRLGMNAQALRIGLDALATLDDGRMSATYMSARGVVESSLEATIEDVAAMTVIGGGG